MAASIRLRRFTGEIFFKRHSLTFKRFAHYSYKTALVISPSATARSVLHTSRVLKTEKLETLKVSSSTTTSTRSSSYSSSSSSCSHEPATSLSERTCWKCGQPNGYPAERFFCHCGLIQVIPLNLTHFDVFNIPQSYDVDLVKLGKIYREFQFILHPDKFVGKSETEKKMSEDLSSLVNNAYTTLQKPLLRGLYLLELYKNPLEEGAQETNPELLMQILEVNEKLAETESTEDLIKIWQENMEQLSALNGLVSKAFEADDIQEARNLLTRMKYFQNIDDKLKEVQRTKGLQFGE